MLQTLQLVENTFLIRNLEIELTSLRNQVRAARQIRDENATPVANQLRRDVFVSCRITLHRRNMHTTLVSKRTRADKRRRRGGRKVRDLTHEERRLAQLSQTLRANRFMAQLRLEVGNHRTEIRVPATLAITIDRSLHVTRPRNHRRQRVCNSELTVLMTMNPKWHA